MISLGIRGWSVLSSAGIGPNSLSLALGNGSRPPVARGHSVSGLYEEALPSPFGHILVDFNAREMLGRKGTSSLDRRSALAMVACGQALDDAGIQPDDTNRHRIGIVLGTTMGGLKSMNDYTRETFIEERPYLVNPLLFPNTVMNCAAGQSAIRYGLKGVNATLAGGQLALFNVLSYSANILRNGYADFLLAGAVEEFTPHMAWATYLTGAPNPPSPGEGAAVFAIAPGGAPQGLVKGVVAEVLAVATGFCPGAKTSQALALALERCISKALLAAGVAAAELAYMISCESAICDDDSVETRAMRGIGINPAIARLHVKDLLGECHAASGALQLAALLALHTTRPELEGKASLITCWMPEGGVGALIVKGWNRAGFDRV